MSEEALALAANSGASPNSLDAETVELVKTKLINGGIFLKHAAAASFIGKKSKYRSVWCAPSLKVIQWGEMDKKKHSGSMLVSDLRRVLVGNISETFKKLGKSVKNPNVCFSLQDSNRTLDLECVSQADRDMWVMCFKFLLPNNEDADAELAADEKMVEDNAPGKSKEQIAMERKAAMEKRKSVCFVLFVLVSFLYFVSLVVFSLLFFNQSHLPTPLSPPSLSLPSPSLTLPLSPSPSLSLSPSLPFPFSHITIRSVSFKDLKTESKS